MLRNSKGFTLIELLVVIAILSILLVIVLVAINPAKQTRDARNSQRQADTLTILNAVNQYFIDGGSSGFPDGTPAAGAGPKSIDSTTMAGTDFCTDLVPTFVAKLSFDPSNNKFFTDCTDYDTGYTIEILADADRTKISAPSTEGNITTISATR